MKQRDIGQAVISRVVRLNPTYHEGCRIRGAHGLTSKSYRSMRGDVSKGTVIRKFGRQAWDRMPPDCVIKEGKRAYITREAFEDNVWMSERGR